ncbi:acyl-CoA dehydrogenase family protein [Pseudonocardia dioxanivorans]|uniref:acyl-CoA dehydrogenase family protein n=2 Tax=Pseudonocardia dioxanivorans TaxID=240495 RepID=UPI001F283BE3|nr:acyl-CoA dehydrogenase family protein [Pseudonocardia dioxanivorans]
MLTGCSGLLVTEPGMPRRLQAVAFCLQRHSVPIRVRCRIRNARFPTMAFDFTLTAEQQKLQNSAREFAQEVLAPIARTVDEEPDPLRAFQLMKPAYAQAVEHGIAYSMLPKEYGGGGLSNVDFLIAAEEIQAVDPGFGTTVLVNGLGLMPVWYYGTEEQKQRFISRATGDTSGEFIVGYAASEPPGSPGGTANFDAPAAGGAGMAVTAVRDGDDYVINGRKYWPCNVAGWDGQGADLNLVVVRTDSAADGTSGLSAIIVERGTPGVTYNLISTVGQRSAQNAEIIFDNARVPAANLIEGTAGNGDLLINRNFAWSGPVAGIGAVGIARAAYEAALDFAKTYTAGGASPIINFQYPGYVLGDVAAKIEAARAFCYKTAHYIDTHDYHGEMIGAMSKVFSTELMFDCVYKCMQVVGVNSLDRKHDFGRLLREAAVFPLYDAGNFGMQRRRVHGVMADPSFDPRTVMDHKFQPFTKEMEGIGTAQGR